MAELGVKIQDSATFSVVKLEHIWKEEIEFSQSLSAMIKAYYHFVVSEVNFDDNSEENKDKEYELKWNENIKMFYILHDYLINEPEGQLRPNFVSGKVVKLRNQLLFHKRLLSKSLLYLLKLYEWKINGKTTQEFNSSGDHSAESKKTLESHKKLNVMKKLVFTVFRFFLIEGHKVPIIYKEYIMKYYPGGDDFQSYLDFIRGIFKELEHPYRTNDLNFRIRMIAHFKQIKNVLDYLSLQNFIGKHLKDPHDALDLLTVFVNPNDTPYALAQDSTY